MAHILYLTYSKVGIMLFNGTVSRVVAYFKINYCHVPGEERKITKSLSGQSVPSQDLDWIQPKYI